MRQTPRFRQVNSDLFTVMFIYNVQGGLWNPGEQGERSGGFFSQVDTFMCFLSLQLVGLSQVEKVA